MDIHRKPISHTVAPAVHRIRSPQVAKLLRRAACLEMLAGDDGDGIDPVLPNGEFVLIVRARYDARESASPEYTLTPMAARDKLMNLSNRCRVVLECSDDHGDDIVLVRGAGRDEA